MLVFREVGVGEVQDPSADSGFVWSWAGRGPAPYVGSSGLGGGGDQGPPSSISVRMPMSMDEAYTARCPHSSMGRLESLEEVVEALSSALSLSCPSSS